MVGTTVITWVFENLSGWRPICDGSFWRVRVLALVTWLAPLPVAAQQEKTARGTVTSVAGNTLSVKAGTSEMKFAVDAKTIVTAEGGGTANRAAAEKGTGPKLSELVKVGEAVEVSYHETGATLHAVRVRRVPSAGAGGGGTSDARAAAKSRNIERDRGIDQWFIDDNHRHRWRRVYLQADVHHRQQHASWWVWALAQRRPRLVEN